MSHSLILDVNIEEPSWSDTFPNVESFCHRIIEHTLTHVGFLKRVSEAEVSVLLTNDDAIAHLNASYRQKDKATNVLSFPVEELTPGEYDDLPDEMMLGDIVLALETVQREAADEGKSLSAHLSHLLVHGTLHLLGYDHIDDIEAEEMESLEAEVLEGLGVKNPYED